MPIVGKFNIYIGNVWHGKDAIMDWTFKDTI